MFNIDQLITIITLMVKSIKGQGWTSFTEETCNGRNQVYYDGYEILSRDAGSGLNCAIISKFSNCQTCLFVLSTKTCACIYRTDNATTPAHDLKTTFSNGWDTAKYYVLKKSPTTGTCRSSNYTWIPDLQVCIRMIADKMKYSSAVSECSRDGAHILMLKTHTKTLSVYRYLICKGYISAYWLGLGDHQTKGVHKWIDGSPAMYTDWYPGEPSMGNVENCARLEYRKELKKYSWMDIYCSRSYSVICEK